MLSHIFYLTLLKHTPKYSWNSSFPTLKENNWTIEGFFKIYSETRKEKNTGNDKYQGKKSRQTERATWKSSIPRAGLISSALQTFSDTHTGILYKKATGGLLVSLELFRCFQILPKTSRDPTQVLFLRAARRFTKGVRQSVTGGLPDIY